MYRGLGAVAVGSAPGAALFFTVYEASKARIGEYNNTDGRKGIQPHWIHMSAACTGEVAACLVRVPTEVIKTRMQTNSGAAAVSLMETVKGLVSSPGGISNLYRGFGITIMREIPFALIQFPIYERLKVVWSDYQNSVTSPSQGALCGSCCWRFCSACFCACFCFCSWTCCCWICCCWICCSCCC